MNLNEVEKHVKFDLIFQLLIYIGIGLCLLLSLIVILATPAKAASNNINSNSHSTCGSSMGSGSYYGAFQNGTCYSRAIGTTYSGQANLVGFWLNYNFQAGKYYTITVNFKDNDLLSSTIVDVVRVVDVANNRNEWSSSYNFISKKQFKVYFLAPNNTSSLAFSLASGSGDPITGISNYGIASIYLEDNDNSDEIITANNQNTQNIINNNNSNAQETQSVIFESANSIINVLQVACKNLFDIEHLHPNGNNSISQPSDSSFMLNLSNSTNQGFTTDYIPVVKQGTYSFKASWSTGLNYAYMVLNIKGYDSLKRELNYNVYDARIEVDQVVTITMPVAVDYIKVSYLVAGGPYNGQIQFGDPVINYGSSPIQYCKFGTSDGNRLEEIGAVLGGIGDNINTTNDKLQDEYDYLTDDTDPTVNTGEINNVIGSVNVQDPLNYLLTLPLNLLTKLNTVISSGTCSRASFGELYGTELYLPCINFENYLGSNLWSTIDTIVGIGLLAIILKKFYDTISNILSLGKEEEIRKGMELPTPMEFFAQILGGGK